MWPKLNKYESAWEILLEQVAMINSCSTAVEECQPGASGRYCMEEAFLGMKLIWKKEEPRGRKRETKA